MSKVTVVVAVFVGFFAVGIYLWQNELVSLLSKEDSAVVSSEIYQSSDNDNYEETTKKSEDGKKVKNTENQAKLAGNGDEQPLKGKEVERNQKDKKATETDKEPDAMKPLKEKLMEEEEVIPPVGHLQELGKHGSQIIEGEIEELDYVPNGKDFYTHFIRKRTPLIMRGAAKSWPAVKNWANESYLLENYAEVIFDVEFTKKYERKHPVKRTMNMKEYLNIYKKESVYLDSPFPQSNLTRDILVPYCLQCEEISKTIASTHLLFSSGGTSSSCHQDGYENLLTLVAGTKEVLVANSSYTEYFYPNNFTTVPGLSPIDPDAVDLVKYPDLVKVPFHKVVLQPGDILYIPQTWWHHVRSTGCPNIGISLWFHQFPFKEEDVDVENESTAYEDVVKNTRKFEAYVETFPETIDCHSQNKPISEVYKPDLNDWDTPKKNVTNKKYVTLASGHKMPMFGLGTAGLLTDTKAAALAALNAGYRMFDTAQAYDNEEALGEAVEEGGVPRDEIFIVSKVHPRFLGYEDTLKSVEKSLQRLKGGVSLQFFPLYFQENLSSSVLEIKELESRLAKKSEKLARHQEEIKALEASLEEAVLEDSQRFTSLKKTVEDKEMEVKEVRELLVAKDEKIQKLELNIREHRVALNDHETFVETLNGQVKQLTKELQETKSTAETAEKSPSSNSLCEKTIKELENKNEIMKALVKSLEETRANLEKEKDNSSKLVQKEKNEKEEIQKKLVALEQQFSQLQKQLHSKEEALIALKESEFKAEMDSEAIINRENLLISEREDLKKRINEAEIKIRKLEEVVSRSKDSSRENPREVNAEMENEKRLKLEITRLQESLLETKNENEKLLKSQKDLSDRLEDAKLENTDLKVNESKLLSENEKLEESLRFIKSEMKTLEEKTKGNEAKLVILEKAKLEFEREKNIKKGLESEIIKLEELLHSASAKKTELERTVKAKDDMLGNLKTEKERFAKERETRTNREKRLEKDKQRIGELMLAAENKCKELERNLREKDKLLKNLEKTPTEAQKEEKSNSIETDSLVSSLQKQLEEATIALDKKNTQLIARNNNVKRLELTLAETKTELQRLKLVAENHGYRENPKDGNEAKEEMQAVIDQQRENIKRLEEKAILFENQKQEIIVLEEKLSEFGSQNEELKTLQEKVSKFEKLKEDFEEHKKNTATLEKQQEELQKEFDDQSADLEVARAQLTDTNKMLNSRNAEVEALESKLGQTRDYERCMDVLRSELLLARDCGRLKEAELDEMKKENTRLREMKKSMAEENAKQDKTLACLKEVIQENEKILDEQEKALEIRQNEMEVLTADLNAERERADTLVKEIERRDTQLGNLKEEINFLTEENNKFEKEQSLEVSKFKKEKIGLMGKIEVQRCTIEQLKGEQGNSDKWSTKEKDLLEIEINEKDEKIQKLREQMKKLEEDKENLEDVLDEKERSLKKTEEQKEKTMKAMREALEIAKAKKIEYETNLQETKETCEREITEKYEKKCKQFEEELTSRQETIKRLEQQVEELARRSTEQEKENEPEKSVTEETPSRQKNLKRKSSDLTLAEVKRQLVKQQKTSQDSGDDFTPASIRRSTRKSRRNTRSKQPNSPSRLALSPIKGNTDKKVRFMGKFGELVENSGSPGSQPNEQPSVTNAAKKLMHSKPQTPKQQENTPSAKPSTAKKGRRKLLQLAALEPFAASPDVQLSMDSIAPRRVNNRDIITRTLRSRTINSTK